MDSGVIIPSLYVFCADSVVRDWENREARSIFSRELKRLPSILTEDLVRAFVRNGKLTDAILCQLLPGVRDSLALPNCTFLRKAAIRKIYFYCEHLRYLDLSGCRQVTNTIVHLILQNCGQLVRLNLSSCVNLSDYAFLTDSSPFDALVGLYNLEYINLSNCCQLTGSCIISILKLAVHLDTIVLRGCRSITRDAIEKLLSYPFLSSVDVSGIPSLEDSSLRMLADSAFPHQLAKLYLSVLNVSEATLCSVVCRLHSLRVLHIGCYTGLTDDMLIQIADSCPDLVDVDISNCGSVTDRGVRHLLSRLKLRSLDISFCTGVTRAAFEGPDCSSRTTLQTLRLMWCPQLVDSLEDIHLRFVSLQQIYIKGCGCSPSVVRSIMNNGIKVTS